MPHIDQILNAQQQGTSKRWTPCVDCGALSRGKRCRNCYYTKKASQPCPSHPDRLATAKGVCRNCRNKQLYSSDIARRRMLANRSKKWRQSNPEKFKQGQRDHYARTAGVQKQRRKEWWASLTLEQRWEAHLKYARGLTAKQYYELLAKQEGKCAICGVRSKGKLHVDHDHATGHIRELLCNRCNTLVGYLEKLPDGTIDCVVKYVENYRILRLEKAS